MGRSTVHYADNKTNNALKKLHNKLRPAGTPVQRVEYIIELLLLRIFETKIKQDEEFKPLRKLFSTDFEWKNPKTGQEESNENKLFSYLQTVSNDQILAELNDNFFPFYSTILQSARIVFEGNLPQKVQDQLVLIEEVFSNSNFTNNVNSGNLGEVIDIVTNDIEDARLLETDLLGDAIESALSETGGTKDIGLFRTPDHVRQFMTALIEPTFDDVIFDPACGTGGFLFDAFEFVMRLVDPSRAWPGEKAHSELAEWFDNYFEKNSIAFPSIEQTTKFYRGGVSGIEYLGMIRKMAAINFYIRGLNPANIEQGDSLAKYNPVTDAESKSIILANPPFGAERDQESYPDVWSEFSKESETTILFVKLMFELMKPGGQCAVVVSEGFHTWDQFSAKALRKMLLDEAQLKAVISLPQGIFVSKSGVGPKTSILIFEKGGQTDWTWFYKVFNDGYTMGTNRKEQKGNQLVECLNLYHEYVKLGKKPPENKHQFCIPSEWIKALDPRIKEKIRTETRADMATKGALDREKKEKDLDKKVKAKKLSETEKQEELRLFDQVLENKIRNEIAKRIDKAHLYSFNLSNYKSNLSESQIIDWKEALKDVDLNGAVTLDDKFKKLYSADSKKATTYLAALSPSNALEADIAREYLANLDDNELNKVKELTRINELLKTGAKYPIVKLKDYLILNENKIKPSKIPDQTFITLGVSNEIGIFRNDDLVASETNQSYFLVEKNQFCYNPYRINVGSIGLNPFDYPNQIISGAYLVFGCKEDELNPKYLNALFNNQRFLDYVNDKAGGGVRMNFKFEYMEEWEIPLPDIHEQAEIVQQIERQKAIIKGANLILKNWEIELKSEDKWSKKKISDLCHTRSGGTPARNRMEYWNGNIPWVKTGEICFNKIEQTEEYITKEGMENSSAKTIKKESVLMAMYGQGVTRGRVALLGIDATINQACVAMTIKDNEEILPKYLFYYLMSKYKFLRTLSTGTNQENLNQKKVESLDVYFPDSNTQKSIVDQLDKELESINGLNQIKSSSLRRIDLILKEIWIDK